VSQAATRRIRVLLAEDHTIVRQGLRALLQDAPDLEVVGEAADGRAAVAEAVRLAPDLVIMDLSMPNLNGVEATRQICAQVPAARVLVLSMHAGEEYVRPAIRAGAHGYLVKGSGLADLLAAARAVARGQAFFSPAAAAVLLQEARAPTAGEPGAELSGREREVLQLLAEGHSSREIGAILFISPKTVEGHRARIMAKLGIHDVPGLVRYAVRTGLVSAQ
jgi:two-component system, NarL family, response regulator NreC